MTSSTRSSTIQGDSEGDRYQEKSADKRPGKKQSLLGVNNEDLKAQGQSGGRVVRADGKVELTGVLLQQSEQRKYGSGEND
jgi:hypothetical protein